MPEVLLFIAIGCFVFAGMYYLFFAASRAATAESNSEIKVENDHVHGKGYVGAIGKSVLDADHGVSVGNFHLTYGEMTSVSTSNGWLIIIAAGSQYTLKVPHAENLMIEIQENIRKAKSA